MIQGDEWRAWREIPLADEAATPGGIAIEARFPDPEGLLDTAYAFLGRLKAPPLTVTVEKIPTEAYESCSLLTAPGRCRIGAADTEGIRRGIYQVADLLRERPPSAWPVAERRMSPKITLRISRYRFAQEKRPIPHELDEDADFYPDAFLDRYAQEGVNAVWFNAPPLEKLCITAFTPGDVEEKRRKQAKLQRIVDQCRRYGIRVFPYLVTPQPWAVDNPILKTCPDIAGPLQCGRRYFCPAFADGKRYLYDCMRQLFGSVKNLGGMLHIVYGEGASTCLNLLEYGPIPCNEKCGLSHGAIMGATLDALQRGMRDAAAEAQLIAWFYAPFARKLPEWMPAVLKEAPRGIVFQMNGESGIEPVQLGKPRYCGDYWQCIADVSPYYVRFAELAAANGHAFAAKIQVGASHEVASLPYLPVPALTYRKYQRLVELGTSGAMQGWGAGGTPGMMNIAARRLSFTDFAAVAETDFLRELARTLWGDSLAGAVAEAWSCFSEAYTHYPYSNMIQYFGPVADGVVWPLYLYPQFKPLFPTWTLHPGQVSGDNVCECLDNHSLDELVTLFERLSEHWSRGVELLRAIRSSHRLNAEQDREVALAEAIGIHFGTAFRIMRFYQLRRRLFADRQREDLETMREIVVREREARRTLIALQQADPLLGYNPEAGGWKYDRPKLEQGIAWLDETLAHEFPRAERELLDGTLDARLPCQATYRLGSGPVDVGEFRWSAEKRDNRLLLDVVCPGRKPVLDELFIGMDDAGVSFPWLAHFDAAGRVFTIPADAESRVEPGADGWRVRVTVPEAALPGGSFRGLRLNVVRLIDGYDKRCSWPAATGEQLVARLNLVFYNPANMGRILGA